VLPLLPLLMLLSPLPPLPLLVRADKYSLLFTILLLQVAGHWLWHCCCHHLQCRHHLGHRAWSD